MGINTFKRDLWMIIRHFWTGFLYIIDRIFHRYRSPEDRRDEEDISGKIVVITGANSGIGKALAYQLAKRGATIVMACRNIATTGGTIAEIRRDVPGANLIFVPLDLEDLSSVRACAARIEAQVPHINLLVCNAGGMNSAKLERTKDGLERTMARNHLGHFLLTNLLLDLVKKGAPSRIVVMTSMAHLAAALDPDDLNMEKDQTMGFQDLRPYNNSKLCNALFVRELARRVESDGIHVYGLCPGLVDSNFFSNVGGIMKTFFYGKLWMPILGGTPEQGIETVLYCALSKETAEDTGKLYRFRKYWRYADVRIDDELARQVWDASERLVGLKPVPGDNDIFGRERRRRINEEPGYGM